MVNKKEKSKNALQTIEEQQEPAIEIIEEQQEPAFDNLLKNYLQKLFSSKK